MSIYVQTLEYCAAYDEKTATVTAMHDRVGVLATLRILAIVDGDMPIPLSDITYKSHTYLSADTFEVRLAANDRLYRLQVTAVSRYISWRLTNQEGLPCAVRMEGAVGACGTPEHDAFSTRIDRIGGGLRSAIGPATSRGDNAIFDRKTGTATVITAAFDKPDAPDTLNLGFDFEKGTYICEMTENNVCITLHTDLYQKLFGIPYSCVNKRSTFPTPPAGWMTWYAVKFDASEQVILDNAAIMREKLYDYGADVLWVDWEWQHGALTKEGPYGVDVFTPFSDRYPNGLAYLADRLASMDLVPALWVGFTHEPGLTRFIEEHPETVLRDYVYWYGRYTFDPSHPTWREQYLIPAAKQVPAMGYRALKWDCLPTGLSTCDYCRGDMYSKQSGHRAMHEAVEIVRDIVGKDFYMMSCSGESDRSVFFASDVFDGARIGGDVFTWEAFQKTAERLCHLYSLHNTVLYCDPDNVVIRDEFNSSKEEKQSRASLVSLLGLPITIGDDLRMLPEEDLEYYRRALPPIDAHPCDVRDHTLAKDGVLTVNLAVSRQFAKWNTIGIFNFAEEERTITLSLSDELFLADGAYHVYDYWHKSYLGTEDATLTITLEPHECRVLRLTPVTDIPTVICTSRHLTGGAPDLLDIRYEGGALIGRSAVVKGDEYTVTVYDPKKATAKTVTLVPDATGKIEWRYEG